MNENLDLTKILDGCPKGTELYSTVYGKVQFERINNYDSYPIKIKVLNKFTNEEIADGVDILDFKPYLFPLSSITDEQRNNICELLLDTQNKFSPYGEINTKGCDNLFISSVKQSNVLINYYLANHLDINGLIEEGLAIDAMGLNIY